MRKKVLAVLLVMGLVAVSTGCTVPAGNVSGKVTNSLTGKPVSGVAVTAEPPVTGLNVRTGSSGAYSAILPQGTFTLTFTKDGFTPVTRVTRVTIGQKLTLDIVLSPVSRVVVSAGVDQTASPGGSVSLKVTAETLDDSRVTGYRWEQVSGVTATIDNPNRGTIKVTLGSNLAAYKEQLLSSFVSYDRFGVQAINPTNIESAGTTIFKVTASTSSGQYSDTVKIVAGLPYSLATCLENVPVGLPVFMRGKVQASYGWLLTPPPNSKATLDNASVRYPSFTPDVTGKYTVKENQSGASLDVYAGTWSGSVTGVNEEGHPQAAVCMSCHDGKTASDEFTAWTASGHANVFSYNLDDNPGYRESCLPCHTVGFDKNAVNGGFDDVADYKAFVSSGMMGKPADNNWENALLKYPETAGLANVQCESCHGPNEGSGLHLNNMSDPARTTICSSLCGTCHGQPLRHGRYQQWQQSGHGNFELAEDDATVDARAASAAHCGRCHAGQGFLAWLKQGDLTKQIQGAKGNATVDELRAMGLTKEAVQPVACAVCHDPHYSGEPGEENRNQVRIMGDTSLLPAGFEARTVGQGALCITCHNSRNGPHNDANAPTSYSAPHTASQGDVLIGENAYFVPRKRSSHAFIKDTCATCHMELTPPPAELSYESSGTNHSFKATLDLCAECHSDRLDSEAFTLSHEGHMEELARNIGEYLRTKLPEQVTLKSYGTHEFSGKSYDIKSGNFTVNREDILEIEPVEARGQGFIFKFTNPVDVPYSPANESPHTIAVTEVVVQLGDITNDGTTPLIPFTDALVKAGWNYFLIEGDGSASIHNPTWVSEVIDATIEALFPTKGVIEEPAD